jgi:hypothetical protein
MFECGFLLKLGKEGISLNWRHIPDINSDDRKAEAPLRCRYPVSTMVSLSSIQKKHKNLAKSAFFRVFQLLFLQLQTEKLDSPEF